MNPPCCCTHTRRCIYSKRNVTPAARAFGSAISVGAIDSYDLPHSKLTYLIRSSHSLVRRTP